MARNLLQIGSDDSGNPLAQAPEWGAPGDQVTGGGMLSAAEQWMAQMRAKTQSQIWNPNNPVGTETLQTMGMSDPSFRPGVFVGGGTVPVSQETIDRFRQGSEDLYNQASLLGGVPAATEAGAVRVLGSTRRLANPPPGATSKGMSSALLMDDASRLGRAKAMGFDTDTTWLHGTAGEHTVLDPGQVGGVTSGGDPGVWFTQNPYYASGYAQNAAGIRGEKERTIEAYLRAEKPLVVRFPDGPVNPEVNGKVMDFTTNKDIMDYAIKHGHDVVYMPDGNFSEESAAASVLRSGNIRSVDARFDPAKGWSDDITH